MILRSQYRCKEVCVELKDIGNILIERCEQNKIQKQKDTLNIFITSDYSAVLKYSTLMRSIEEKSLFMVFERHENVKCKY